MFYQIKKYIFFKIWGSNLYTLLVVFNKYESDKNMLGTQRNIYLKELRIKIFDFLKIMLFTSLLKKNGSCDCETNYWFLGSNYLDFLKNEFCPMLDYFLAVIWTL